MNDEWLRQRLLAGDPAGEDGLTPDEVHAMRRTVLTAVPEPRRRFLPALALAGAAAAAILIALFAWRPSPAEAPAPRIAAVTVQPAGPGPSPLPPQTEPAPREDAKPRRGTHRRHRNRAVPQEAATLAALQSSANPGPDSGTRQVQLTAPGGTRIIWILKSGKASR